MIVHSYKEMLEIIEAARLDRPMQHRPTDYTPAKWVKFDSFVDTVNFFDNEYKIL
jgi:hypothetical protein